MSKLTLEKTRIIEGVWEGRLTRDDGYDGIPLVSVKHLDQEIEGVMQDDIPNDANSWTVKVPIPANLLAEGVHTFVILDAKSGETLNSFSVITGEALAEDIRAEVDLLRDELDMLKRAFRRHCAETAN
ncbi:MULTISPECIES: hypothetical protein [Halocynthiibacter]|uniref:Uncharacterized protein n=1 Tax=Halocynthiibacter halioticoli TaxID=2986804 RepID=A0AAE3J2V1_9RHOB|nr:MULTISPECIES: hypothetical protein [Halocynthiibacter]MCV6825875.1 hypothetical protein [Halocynthiibacter halioticoli]MCW4058876.1 hypothetical protein [Halocynthiibacter sp. SDUM655004]